MAGEEDDCVVVSDNFTLERSQKKRKHRQELRRKYRKLIHRLNSNQYEFTNPSSDDLNDALVKADELYKQVDNPQEGSLDATTMYLISTLDHQRAQNLRTDFLKFLPVKFAENLIKFMCKDKNASSAAEISRQEWISLGSAYQHFFKRSPTFHFMLGSLRRDEVQKVRNIQSGRKRDKENLKDKATVPKQMKSFDSETSEVTSTEVAKIKYLLNQCYRGNDEYAVCYFKFVLNPKSFTETVENIFYTSFLVRDGDAEIFLYRNWPYIVPVNKSQLEQMGNKKFNQTIITITPKEWKELVDVCDIPPEKSLIPTRNITEKR